MRWLALEAMKTPALAQTSAADVWAFGVVIWEICTLGMIPFSAVKGIFRIFGFLHLFPSFFFLLAGLKSGW